MTQSSPPLSHQIHTNTLKERKRKPPLVAQRQLEMLRWPLKTHQFYSCLVIAGKSTDNANNEGAYLKSGLGPQF